MGFSAYNEIVEKAHRGGWQIFAAGSTKAAALIDTAQEIFSEKRSIIPLA